MSSPLRFPDQPKFDPVAVNRTIDNMLAAIPSGQHGILVLNADLQTKRASGALMFRVTNNIGGYVRVSKVSGSPLDVDAGAHISFLYDSPSFSDYTYAELVDLFKARGWSLLKSHWSAYKLVRGQELEISLP